MVRRQCRSAKHYCRRLGHGAGAFPVQDIFAPAPRLATGLGRRLALGRGATACNCKRTSLSGAARNDTGHDLLHFGDLRAAERCDAFARQHHRQCHLVPGNAHGAIDRHVPVHPAAFAHVRAHRRLLSPALAGRKGRLLAWRGADRRRSGGAGADGHVRGASHLREVSRPNRSDTVRVRREALALCAVRGARLASRAGRRGAARSPGDAIAASTGGEADSCPSRGPNAADGGGWRRARSGDCTDLHRARAPQTSLVLASDSRHPESRWAPAAGRANAGAKSVARRGKPCLYRRPMFKQRSGSSISA